MPTLNLGRVRFNWRGDYDPLANYLTYDVVKSDGQSYVCIADVTGTGPHDTGGATYWEGVLLRGDDYNAARDEAVQAASDASSSASSASSSAGTASSAATTATGARDEAQQWATEAEDIEVEPGLYSAYHWAQKAMGAFDPNLFNVTAEGTEDSRQLQTWMAQVLQNYQNLQFVVAKTADTGAASLPYGTTAQRPATPVYGYTRGNTDIGALEWWNGSSWQPVGSGAKGGAGNQIFVENDQVVTADYTIPSNKNASSTGPLTIADGVKVTVSDGARWVIL